MINAAPSAVLYGPQWHPVVVVISVIVMMVVNAHQVDGAFTSRCADLLYLPLDVCVHPIFFRLRNFLAVSTLPPGHVRFFFQQAPVTQQRHSGVVTSIVSKALSLYMNAIDFQKCHFPWKHF